LIRLAEFFRLIFDKEKFVGELGYQRRFGKV